MNASSVGNNGSDIRSAAARSANIIDLLVERAKSDRTGVYWPVPPAFKQYPAAQIDTTLAAGSAGIMLALAEFHRSTKDPAIGELLGKANAWLGKREQRANFTPGFYFGNGGIGYAKALLHEVLPELAAGNQPSKAPAANPATPGLASVSKGMAGTLVGMLSNWAGEGECNSPVVPALISGLAQHPFPSPDGIFWDLLPHAVRPPLGFLNGSAGIDYAFAGAHRILRRGYAELVASSVGHANARFDARTGNWPDFEGTALFGKLGEPEMLKLVQRARASNSIEANFVEDSLGWGTGAAGILLARAAAAEAFAGSALAETCRADCERAIHRLAAATDADLRACDLSLQNGLPGILLSIRAYRATGVAAQHPIPAGLEARLLAHMDQGAGASSDDLSLLTGVAGLAYAWLKLDSSAPAVSCLNPLARTPAAALGRDTGGVTDLPILIGRRLPRTAALAARGTRIAATGISLTAIEGMTVDYRTEHAATLEVKAANYELELYRQLAAVPSFRHHLFRESYKRMRYAQSYGPEMNDTLLLECFRLDEAVTLMELDFDPSDPAAEIKAQKTRLIRHQGSHGIVDAKVSPLQLALLEQFRVPAVVIEVINAVIARVQTPNVTQRQLAELSLKQVRAFVAAGYLFPETPGRLKALLIRKRCRRAQRNLFPSELNR